MLHQRPHHVVFAFLDQDGGETQHPCIPVATGQRIAGRHTYVVYARQQGHWLIIAAHMRRLKLGRLLDTLPERLALARTNHMPHHDFLEMLLADEVTRDREATQRRARAAQLDPQMQLAAWDDSTEVHYNKQLWAELTSLRFLADACNVLLMGPVGGRKTFMANALGHIAVHRGHSVHAERADKLLNDSRPPASMAATTSRWPGCIELTYC
jgi:IstB-like ATP binding protein